MATAFSAMLQNMFVSAIKDNPEMLSTILAAQVQAKDAELLTPKKEKTPPPKKHSPRKTRNKRPSPKTPGDGGGSAKKRKATPTKKADLRRRLGKALLPLVDRNIRDDSVDKKLFKSGESGNFFDGVEFQPYVATAVQLVMGEGVNQMQMLDATKICKSVVKSRRTYVRNRKAEGKRTEYYEYSSVAEAKAAKKELVKQLAIAAGKDVEAESKADGEAESDDDDGVAQLTASDLFSNSSDEDAGEARSSSPMAPELACLEFDDMLYPCVCLGCDEILSVEKCFPKENRGTEDPVWCKKHWTEQQQQLLALEKYRENKRKMIKNGLHAKMAALDNSPAKSEKAGAANKSKKAVRQSPNVFFKYDTDSVVTCEWPPDKSHYLAQITMRIVSGSDPRYDVYFPEDGNVRKNVPEMQIKPYIKQQNDEPANIYAVPRKELIGSTFVLPKRQRHLKRGGIHGEGNLSGRQLGGRQFYKQLRGLPCKEWCKTR